MGVAEEDKAEDLAAALTGRALRARGGRVACAGDGAPPRFVASRARVAAALLDVSHRPRTAAELVEVANRLGSDPTDPTVRGGRYRRSVVELPEGSLALTFWERLAGTDDPDGCWFFTGWLDKDGYGILKAGGFHQRAHRVAWALTHGPIPDSLQINHSCDRPPCANPAHLYAGTQLENMADAMERGRHVATRRQIDDAQPTLWGLTTGRSNRSPVAGS